MIGYAMLYTVAVSVPLASTAVLGARFLRNHGRAERAIWILAIAATLLVPAFMLSRPAGTPPSDSWVPAIQVAAFPVSDVLLPAQAQAPAARAPIDVDALLLSAWGLASLLLVVRWLVSSIRLRRLSGSWLSDNVDGVHVLLTSELGPAVTGVLRPRVVLPAWVPALPRRQRALVLLHEQEHIRARDPHLILFAKLTRIVTPWNPVSWLLASCLERAVELDCDRRVLRRHPDVEEYGETLIVVSARGSHRLLAAVAFAETDIPLRKRILAMTTPPRTMTVAGVVATIAAGALLVTGAVALPAPAVLPPASLPIVQSESVTVPSVALPSISPTPPAAARPSPDSPSTSGSVPIASTEFAQQSLPAPRVIADPRHAWLNIYRLQDVRAGGIGPDAVLARFPLTENVDSLTAVAIAMFGDTLIGIESTATLGTPPPQTTIQPRLRNPEEVVRAIANAYPPDLRDRGLGGTVGMQFLVGPTGQVETFRIGQISAYPALDEAALRVAEVYRFSPAMRGRDALAVWVAHAISFYPPN